ncbi:MAG: NmrA family NAD(P)-binding protein [Bacteroidota bacterium]
MSKILLFNATGAQGGTIAARLIEKGYEVLAPARSLEKVEKLLERNIKGFSTDFSEESLRSIIERVDQIILQIPAAVAPQTMITIAQNAMKAILSAGYPKTVFVISSTITGQKIGVPSVDARVEMVNLAKTYLPDTPILSATEYLENFSTAYREPILQNNIIPQTIPPDFPVNYLSWADLATYVIAVLESDQLEGKIYPIGGKEGLNGRSLAERLGTIIGRKLKYVPISHKDLEGILTPILGPDVAKDYAAFYQWQDTAGADLLNPDTSSIRHLLNIELPDFEVWARAAFKN